MFGAVIVWFGLSILAAVVAGNKGRSAIGFFFLALLLSPLVGLTAAIVVSPHQENMDTKALSIGSRAKCPYCAELVRAEAITCRYCGRALTQTKETVITNELIERLIAQRKQDKSNKKPGTEPG